MRWCFSRANLLMICRDYLEQKSINEKKAQMSTDLPNLSMETLSKWIELADWDFFFYLFITPVLYGIFIPVIDQLYTRVARRLNHWENHKTDSSFQTHLILKVFSFRFVHVFASLYYYAFASDSNLLKVAIQLAAFMIAGQAWNNFMETGLPFIKRRTSAWSHRRQTNQQIQRSSVFKNPTAPKQLPSGRESRSVLRRGRNTYTSDENRRINGRIQEQCMRLEQATAIAWEVWAFIIDEATFDLMLGKSIGKIRYFRRLHRNADPIWIRQLFFHCISASSAFGIVKQLV